MECTSLIGDVTSAKPSASTTVRNGAQVSCGIQEQLVAPSSAVSAGLGPEPLNNFNNLQPYLSRAIGQDGENAQKCTYLTLVQNALALLHSAVADFM